MCAVRPPPRLAVPCLPRSKRQYFAQNLERITYSEGERIDQCLLRSAPHCREVLSSLSVARSPTAKYADVFSCRHVHCLSSSFRLHEPRGIGFILENSEYSRLLPCSKGFERHKRAVGLSVRCRASVLPVFVLRVSLLENCCLAIHCRRARTQSSRTCSALVHARELPMNWRRCQPD